MWFAQRKLRKLVAIEDLGKSIEALRELAFEMGCRGRVVSGKESASAVEHQIRLIADIRDARRLHILERQWIVTVVAATAAVVSALVALVAVGMAAREPPDATVQAAPASYEVMEVIDGDTLTIVDSGGIRTRVRLRSVDAPEMDEPGGPEAKAALEAELLGRQVNVTPYARDRYGRLIADVDAPDAR